MPCCGRYILDGTEPVKCPDLDTWGIWLATANRHVADIWLSDTLRISTVFLGLDHQFGSGPPLLFETMVFEGGHARDEMERYSTWHEAEQGHEAMVIRMREEIHAS